MTDDEKAAQAKETLIMRGYVVQMCYVACRMLSDRNFLETATIVGKDSPDHVDQMKQAEETNAHYLRHIEDLDRNTRAQGLDFGHWDNEGLEALSCSFKALRILVKQGSDDLARVGLKRVAAGMGRSMSKTLAGLIGVNEEDDDDEDNGKVH